ncbi:MAG: purine-nucleoside phosphorylase [Oscillospiraceae bacterium]|nr:purine-nucleoside phosphorylase [Oscillospiraceae bacterium]
MNFTYADYAESSEYVKNIIKDDVDIAVVLGSGLGSLTNEFEEKIELPYGEIPNFPQSTVESHAGKMIYGKLSGKKVLAMSGRFHYYEGYSFAQTTLPIRVMKLLGVKKLILTNAAGGINPDFSVGDFMVLTDHIKFFTQSPVRGKNVDEFGKRFFDMSETYSKDLIDIASDCAKELQVPLKKGVYAYMPGPQFETPAEIKALSILGADAVGMSTVAEAIVANQCGIKILGISCISNMGAGIADKVITDEEVVEVTNSVSYKFKALIAGIVEKI